MSDLSKGSTRLIVTTLAFLLMISLLAWRFAARAQTGSAAGMKHDVPLAYSQKDRIDGIWSPEERARELVLLHELNRKRVARTHPLGTQAVGAEATVEDINDISVIRDDGTLLI